MQIAFFLIPKNDVIYVKYDSSMREALEKMEYYRYTAIPLVDEQGKYRGTITEGDLLWKLKNTPGLTFENTGNIPLSEVKQNFTNHPVLIDAQMEDLFSRAIEQNFIPVVDDQRIFIGIIRRREILEYCYKRIDKMPSIYENGLPRYEACMID